MNHKPRVLVIGHSYVSRLMTALTNDQLLQHNFNLQQCVVNCYGIREGKQGGLQHDVALQTHIKGYQPSIILLQIGGTYAMHMTAHFHIHDRPLSWIGK